MTGAWYLLSILSMTLNELLAEARERKGLTLRDLEDMTGLSNALLSQIETGAILEPSFTSIVKISKALGLSLNKVADCEPAVPPNVEAPGLVWKRFKDGWEARWVVPPTMYAAGFGIKSERVWRGKKPTPADRKFIQEHCAGNQAEMLQWAKEHGRSSEG